MSIPPPKVITRRPPPPKVQTRRWSQGDVAFIKATVAAFDGDSIFVEMERGTFIQVQPDEILTVAEAHERSRL